MERRSKGNLSPEKREEVDVWKDTIVLSVNDHDISSGMRKQQRICFDL
jgi:hypothetical protein